MRRGPTPGAVYDLEADEITIGRGNKSGIVIRDNEVSRDHCRLVRLTDAYQVTDLNSSNGTFVNGQRVLMPWLLQPGALIELGDSITLEYGVSEDHNAPEAGSPQALQPTAYHSLMMIKGPAVGYSYPLESKLVAIGRDLTNDIVIQDPEVSRYHISLLYSQRGYEVEDMGSTNGTFINGVPLKGKRCLEPDDVIKLGTVVQLQYLIRSEEEDDTPVSRPPDEEYEKGDVLSDYFRVDPERKARAERSTGLMTGALKNHIMIAYARDDWESLVAPLMVRFQDTRLNAWVDQGLPPGSDDWRMAVEQAVRECWLMVLVVSPEVFSSMDVKVMYRYFLEANKPIILLTQGENPTLPGDLNRLRSIVYTPENSERSFHKLIFEIMQLRQER